MNPIYILQVVNKYYLLNIFSNSIRENTKQVPPHGGGIARLLYF